jgi:hypothetical protein
LVQHRLALAHGSDPCTLPGLDHARLFGAVWRRRLFRAWGTDFLNADRVFVRALPRLDHAWSFRVIGRRRLFGARGTNLLDAIFRRERVSGTRRANLLGADDWVFWTFPRLDHAGGRLLCRCRGSRRHGEREDRGTKDEQADTDLAEVFAMALAHKRLPVATTIKQAYNHRGFQRQEFLACLRVFGERQGGVVEKPFARAVD